jgi:hypothetical protein
MQSTAPCARPADAQIEIGRFEKEVYKTNKRILLYMVEITVRNVDAGPVLAKVQ